MFKILLTIFVLIFIALPSKGQDSLVVIDKREYIEIEDGINLSDSIIWGRFSHSFHIPIGFSYEFLGITFDSVTIETTGRMVFDTSHHYFADAFSELAMQDLGTMSGIPSSPITYKNEVLEDGKVLIVQFKNVGFAQDSLSNVSFQIRLYEHSHEFELIMGTSNINDISKTFINGPYCGINKFISFDPENIEYRLAAYGNPVSPSIVSDAGKDLENSNYKLSTAPVEGTVYRFNTNLIIKE